MKKKFSKKNNKLKKEQSFFYKKLRQRSGAALLVILAVFAILMPLVQGVWSDSQSYYQFRRSFVDKMKARSHAQAGLDLSLLRLYLFKGAEKSLPKKIKSQFLSVLDQTWIFPFQWPLKPMGGLLKSEIDRIEEINNLSLLKGGYFSLIQPEDGLLDLNNLSSPLEFLREFTYSSLLQLLTLEIEENEELKDKYDESSLREILNNITDWTDLDRESLNGGRESGLEGNNLALNRSFISLEELKKVPKLEEDLYHLLEPYITVYGSKSLNINYTKDKVLSSLGLPPDLVEQIVGRINSNSEFYRPFADEEDFCDFNVNQGFDFCSALKETYGHLDMLSFDSPIAFRIKSRGLYRSQSVELEALLYDLSASAINYQKLIYLEDQRQKNPNSQEEKKEELESENQNLKIDYSYTKSLVILYMKENHLGL